MISEFHLITPWYGHQILDFVSTSEIRVGWQNVEVWDQKFLVHVNRAVFTDGLWLCDASSIHDTAIKPVSFHNTTLASILATLGYDYECPRISGVSVSFDGRTLTSALTLLASITRLAWTCQSKKIVFKEPNFIDTPFDAKKLQIKDKDVMVYLGEDFWCPTGKIVMEHKIKTCIHKGLGKQRSTRYHYD